MGTKNYNVTISSEGGPIVYGTTVSTANCSCEAAEIAYDEYEATYLSQGGELQKNLNCEVVNAETGLSFNYTLNRRI